MMFRNLKELAAEAGIPLRMARYLVAEGFVPRPGGSKAQPEYDDRHLDAIRQYLTLREQGLTQNLIRRFIQAGSADAPAEVYRLAPGIDLIITPRLLAPATDQHAVMARIHEVLGTLALPPEEQRAVIDRVFAILTTADAAKEYADAAATPHD